MSFRRKLIRIPGKLKGLFFVSRLDVLVPARFFNLLAHMAGLSKWIAKHKKGNKNDFYSWKFNYKKRESLFEQVISSQNLDGNIDYLEFGVSRGVSFNWWIDRIKDKDARFYGFDTFTGLPEAWGQFKKGDMGNGNKPPEINDNRHEFHQGLFQQTLLPFLSTYNPSKRKVIHMDADIYSATLYVLTLMTPFIKSGDILFFDEFNVPMHEYKAFTEWSKSFYIEYEVLGGVNNFYQAVILIK
jgi:O-methyltransferase